jgi:hypothetical protein
MHSDYVAVLEALLTTESCGANFNRIFAGNGGSTVPIDLGAQRVAHQQGEFGWIRDAIGRALESFATRNVDHVRATRQRLGDAQAAVTRGGVWNVSTSARRFRESDGEIANLLDWLDSKVIANGDQAHGKSDRRGGRTRGNQLGEWMIKKRLIDEWLNTSDQILGARSPSKTGWLEHKIWRSCEEISALERQVRRPSVPRRNDAAAPFIAEAVLRDKALEFLRTYGEETPEFGELKAIKPRSKPDPDQLANFRELLIELAKAVSSLYSERDLSNLANPWRVASAGGSVDELARGELGRLVASWDESFSAIQGESRARACLPGFGEDAEGQLSGLVLRLTMLLLFAPNCYLGLTTAAEMLDKECNRLDKASHPSQPNWLKLLTDEARGPEKVAQQHLAKLLNAAATEGPPPHWYPDFIHYALASKGCSVFQFNEPQKELHKGLFGLQYEEPYIGKKTNGPSIGVVKDGPSYRDALAARVSAISKHFRLDLESVMKWLHAQLEGQTASDLPSSRPTEQTDIDPSSADHRIAYLLGHAFSDDLARRLTGSPEHVRAVLLPALTFPLRKQWYGKGLLRPLVPWRRVRWLIRWHAWYCPDFHASIYEILVSQQTTAPNRSTAAIAR